MEASKIGPQERPHLPENIVPTSGIPLSGSLAGRKVKLAKTSEIEQMINFKNINAAEAHNLLAGTGIKHDFVVWPSTEGGYTLTIKTKDQEIIDIPIPKESENADILMTTIAEYLDDEMLFAETKAGKKIAAADFAASEPEGYAIELAEKLHEEICKLNVDYINNQFINIEEQLAAKNISRKGALHLAGAIENALAVHVLDPASYSDKEMKAREHAADLAKKLVEYAGFDRDMVDRDGLNLMSTKEFAGKMSRNEAKAFLSLKKPGDWLIRMDSYGDFIATKSLTGNSYINIPIGIDKIDRLRAKYDKPKELLMCGHHFGVKKKAEAAEILNLKPPGAWLIRCQPMTNEHLLVRKELNHVNKAEILEYNLFNIDSLETVVAKFSGSKNPLDINKGLYLEDV